MLSRNLCERILLPGCQDGCRYRFGAQWAEQRIQRRRDPNLRRRVGAQRIVMGWCEPGSDTRGADAQMEPLTQAAGHGQE